MPKGQYDRTKRTEENLNSSTEEVVASASPDPMSMFLEALKQMSADNRDTTLAAIAEMKKPTEEEQAKKDQEKANLMARVEASIEVARLAEAERELMQSSCNHSMPNGQTSFRGQVNSNGWARVECHYCHKAYHFEATEIEANKSGLNVDKWGMNAHAIIKRRAEESLLKTPPPVPRIPPGATIIFG